MGLLSAFSKPRVPLMALPSGTFSVDCEGRVLVSTLPQSFPKDLVQDIATQVLDAFRSAKESQIPLSEIVIRYASLKLTARELRGGAIIFLAPQTFSSHTG